MKSPRLHMLFFLLVIYSAVENNSFLWPFTIQDVSQFTLVEYNFTCNTRIERIEFYVQRVRERLHFEVGVDH